MVRVGFCVMKRQLVNCLQATTARSHQLQITCRRGVHTEALKLPLWEQRANLSSKLFKARQAELLSTSMSKSTELRDQPAMSNCLCLPTLDCCNTLWGLLVLAGSCSFEVA